MGYVYRYIDLSDNIIKYVGIVWSENRTLEQRVKEHLSDDWCKYRVWKIEYITENINTRTDAEYFEAHYIALYGTDKYFNVSKSGWGISSFLPNRENDWIEYENEITVKQVSKYESIINDLKCKIQKYKLSIKSLEETSEKISLKINRELEKLQAIEYENREKEQELIIASDNISKEIVSKIEECTPSALIYFLINKVQYYKTFDKNSGVYQSIYCYEDCIKHLLYNFFSIDNRVINCYGKNTISELIVLTKQLFQPTIIENNKKIINKKSISINVSFYYEGNLEGTQIFNSKSSFSLYYKIPMDKISQSLTWENGGILSHCPDELFYRLWDVYENTKSNVEYFINEKRNFYIIQFNNKEREETTKCITNLM